MNLWDYIEKGDAGKHTLKFYYTERGLSGSTCYMQFTLPSVSSVTPTYQNGQLKIEKEVVGEADPDAEFSFDISISSDDGLAEGSDYAIVRYSPDGQRIESSLLSGGTGAFKLKADECVLIDYLQHGTRYTIEETNADGFVVSSTIDAGAPTQSAQVTGTMPEGKSSIVLFTNALAPEPGPDPDPDPDPEPEPEPEDTPEAPQGLADAGDGMAAGAAVVAGVAACAAAACLFARRKGRR